MLLKLELSHQKILFGCLFAENISSCTQHSRRAAPLDPSRVMQSCAARLNARLTKQSVNCELLCIIPLSTFTTSESMRSWPLQRSGGSSSGFSLPGGIIISSSGLSPTKSDLSPGSLSGLFDCSVFVVLGRTC